MKKPKNKKSVRLVPHIYPTRYNLTLKPDLENFTFSGSEVIDITIDKQTKVITLHARDLEIESASIKIGKDNIFAKKIAYDKKSETVTFDFAKSITGKVKMTIVFQGIISEGLRGFYRSKYVLDGKTRHIATTQFEATDARRAFPCFDEPAHKAVFDVSLIIPGDHTAISNTLPKSIREHEAGYKIVEFSPTPRMSTYLLAFIIGEFEFVEGVAEPASRATSTKVRVFTTPGKSHQAKFALDVAIKCLEFYNEYFGIPYPLQILDLIALPDFESAAMENWGAVTFREAALLVDDEHTSLANKQWIAIVIAHELAHQWFGNLVTMEWWTDLWLNEGFAEYLEYVCVDHVFPKWNLWDQYLGERYSIALRLDALENSHPVQVTVHHPDEISEVFDMISYAKGSAVIRMLAEYIGPDKFREGLSHYLKKHSYKNTQTTDLWEAFEKVSKKPVKKIMQNWTGKTGYPLLTLSKKGKTYSVSQERFFSSRISSKKDKEKTLWHVPFAYESDSEQLKELLTKKSSPLIGTSIGKINRGESTMARVRYDKETLDRLKDETQQGKLATHDRLGVVRDLFALAEGGYISTDEALEFSLIYKNETEYVVWSEVALGVNRVYNIVRSSLDKKITQRYKAYALSLFSPIAHKMGWNAKDGEVHSCTFLRNLALSQAGMYGDTKVINEATKIFKNRKKNPIRPDIRSVVYGIIAQNGGIKEWQEFKNLYDRESLHEEKDRYARAMTMFRDRKLIGETLKFALSSDVRSQDAPHLLASIWSNSSARDTTWKFIQKNWPTILTRYGEGGHFLSRLLSPLGAHTDMKDLADAKKFFKTHAAPGSARTLEQAYERIESNVAWIKDDKASIKNWLNKNY
ncbi:MAG: M1 family metallopeptidase [bacterium]